MNINNTHLVNVEYSKFEEKGKDVYATILEVNPDGKPTKCLGVGIGDTKEEALELARKYATEKDLIKEGDNVVQMGEKDFGILSFTSGVNELVKRGAMPKIEGAIVTAEFLGKKKEG